jgi:hypothetical protein
MEIETIYKFNGISGLYANTKGNFFYNGKPARKVYNNGSISVLACKSKRGVIKLRRLAYKTTMLKEALPF